MSHRNQRAFLEYKYDSLDRYHYSYFAANIIKATPSYINAKRNMSPI